jgi:hypothetical protein
MLPRSRYRLETQRPGANPFAPGGSMLTEGSDCHRIPQSFASRRSVGGIWNGQPVKTDRAGEPRGREAR